MCRIFGSTNVFFFITFSAFWTSSFSFCVEDCGIAPPSGRTVAPLRGSVWGTLWHPQRSSVPRWRLRIGPPDSGAAREE
uniref:Putative secreted protein n=1 Tax=Ixodes ricinus TaxID=34613 RepID=A0A6B0U645_IXORI